MRGHRRVLLYGRRLFLGQCIHHVARYEFGVQRLVCGGPGDKVESHDGPVNEDDEPFLIWHVRKRVEAVVKLMLVRFNRRLARGV